MKVKQYRVAAVVVTYNRKSMLLGCIAKLCNQTMAPLMHIIIVDNGSTDGTKEALAPLAASNLIRYVNTGENLGGAGGFNRGIRYAVSHGYEYVWVMDDDCMPAPRALEELLVADSALEGDYGFLCSKVLWKNDDVCAMNVPRHHVYCDVSDFDSPLVRADLASFVSLFVPAHTIREIGLPIQEFFIWTDDWEFTRRISRIHKCYLVNGSVVHHLCNENVGADIAHAPLDRLERFRMLYRNDVVLYRGEGMRGFVYELFRLNLHVLRVLLFAKNSKMKRLSAIVGGTADGLAFSPKVERI